jgi:hypothetical protein
VTDFPASREARDAKLAALRATVADDGCLYSWWVVPDANLPTESSSSDWLDLMEPGICGAAPAVPTDAPVALKYDITRVCAQHAEDVVVQEQLAAAVDASVASREWLERNGHEVYTRQQLFGDAW